MKKLLSVRYESTEDAESTMMSPIKTRRSVVPRSM
jgi:hypothetical protein